MKTICTSIIFFGESRKKKEKGGTGERRREKKILGLVKGGYTCSKKGKKKASKGDWSQTKDKFMGAKTPTC